MVNDEASMTGQRSTDADPSVDRREAHGRGSHLRKLDRLPGITKEFQGSKPRTWVQATATGRQAFADYLSNLQRTLGLRINAADAADGRAGSQ